MYTVRGMARKLLQSGQLIARGEFGRLTNNWNPKARWLKEQAGEPVIKTDENGGPLEPFESWKALITASAADYDTLACYHDNLHKLARGLEGHLDEIYGLMRNIADVMKTKREAKKRAEGEDHKDA
jgi:hypothetical protein